MRMWTGTYLGLHPTYQRIAQLSTKLSPEGCYFWTYHIFLGDWFLDHNFLLDVEGVCFWKQVNTVTNLILRALEVTGAADNETHHKCLLISEGTDCLEALDNCLMRDSHGKATFQAFFCHINSRAKIHESNALQQFCRFKKCTCTPKYF